jgi:hypothetical protein
VQRAKVSSSELNAYVLGIAAAMPEFSLTNDEKYIIASAATGWAGDPFLKSELPEQSERPGGAGQNQSAEASLVYSGYIEMAGRRLAIINGIEYEAGDALELPGYFVKRIFPLRVELTREGSPEKIVIQLDETVGNSSVKKKWQGEKHDR